MLFLRSKETLFDRIATFFDAWIVRLPENVLVTHTGLVTGDEFGVMGITLLGDIGTVSPLK